MKLKTCELTDVLPHTSSKFCFGDVLTVFTGLSDSGKSSVIRALDQIFRNRPAGINLLRHGAKRGAVSETVIGLEADDGTDVTIARRRSASRNEYEVNGQQLLAFGLEVPDKVSQVLRLSNHAFQIQSEGNFMLIESDGQVAKMLSGTVGLAQIDAAFSEVRKRKTENDTALRCAEADYRRENDALTPFSGLPEAEVLVEAANRLLVELNVNTDAITVCSAQLAALARLPPDAATQLSVAQDMLAAFESASNAVQKTREYSVDLLNLFLRIDSLPPACPAAVIACAEHHVSLLEELESKRECAEQKLLDVKALVRAIDALRDPADNKPALARISKYARICNEHLVAESALRDVMQLLQDIEMIPERTALDERASEAIIALASIQTQLRNAVQLGDEVDRHLGRINFVESYCVSSLSEMKETQAALDAFYAANPVCPECGAEQQHWHIRGEVLHE